MKQIRNLFLGNWLPLMREGMKGSLDTQQSSQAKGRRLSKTKFSQGVLNQCLIDSFAANSHRR